MDNVHTKRIIIFFYKNRTKNRSKNEYGLILYVFF